MTLASDFTDRGKGKVLVFVVAFNAELHLPQVFERIPSALLSDERIHFACFDDASSDAGPERLADWLREHGVENAKVIRNVRNQGYGGNQKLGYRMALDMGYDFVVLLHGDGQYAPELLPRFIDAWEQEGADVVLGSRMAERGSARRGGMPFYKRVGNRLLTWAQNRLTGLGLSEYHTGYRGYSSSFLAHVPFEANTNDFHFDTEILLQAAHVGARIVEFPIPTRYGDEVCHVPGWRYSINVLLATLRFRLHRMGMLCSVKYRGLAPERYVDKTGSPYTSHHMALDEVARLRPRRVADLGCGPGYVAAGCVGLGADVTAVDVVEPTVAAGFRFHRVDLESDPLPFDPFENDVVLLLDVIEHFAEPERFLVGLRNTSRSLSADRDPPHVVITTPNVAFASIRLGLLLGRYSYAERGILDITHRRLFTRGSLVGTLKDCGYVVEKVRPVPVPFEVAFGGRLGRAAVAVSRALARLRPTLFAFQFLVVCRPQPGVSQLLAEAQTVHAGETAPRTPPSVSAG